MVSAITDHLHCVPIQPQGYADKATPRPALQQPHGADGIWHPMFCCPRHPPAPQHTGGRRGCLSTQEEERGQW